MAGRKPFAPGRRWRAKNGHVFVVLAKHAPGKWRCRVEDEDGKTYIDASIYTTSQLVHVAKLVPDFIADIAALAPKETRRAQVHADPDRAPALSERELRGDGVAVLPGERRVPVLPGETP